MAPPIEDEEIRVRLVSLRLVLGAMIASVVLLALAATWLLSTTFEPVEGGLVLWLPVALVAVGAGELVTWPILRSAQKAGLTKDGPPTAERALEAFSRIRLLGAALGESFALFGVIVYLVTGSQLALLAPAAGIFVLLRLQPDPAAFRDFARSVGVVDQ